MQAIQSFFRGFARTPLGSLTPQSPYLRLHIVGIMLQHTHVKQTTGSAACVTVMALNRRRAYHGRDSLAIRMGERKLRYSLTYLLSQDLV